MRVSAPNFGYFVHSGRHPGRMRKNRWKEGAPIVVPKVPTFNDPRLQTAVEQSGKKVENVFWDPIWEKKEEHPQWVPNSDDPRFSKYLPQPPVTAHPLWKDRTAFVFDEDTRLPCRLDQAKALAKTVVVEGLTPQVENLIGAYKMENEEEIIRRFVLQAVAWDQRKDKLPQWFQQPQPKDPFKFVTREDQLRHTKSHYPLGPSYQKQSENIMRDFMRICKISNHRHSQKSAGAPSLTASIENRHILHDCDFQATVPHLDDDLVHLSGRVHSLVFADAPLPPPVGTGVIADTVQEDIPKLWPIKPTIDLLPKHVYDDEDKLAFKRDGIPTLSHPLVPHTLGISWGKWWERYSLHDHHVYEAEDNLTRAFMITFGAAVAQARLQFGPSVQGDLPSPVVLQSIATNGFNFNFLTIQLNTLDFTTTDGVKNIAWIDAGEHNNIREDWRPTTFYPYRGSQKPYVSKEFNPVVFEKFLATYLNGAVQR